MPETDMPESDMPETDMPETDMPETDINMFSTDVESVETVLNNCRQLVSLAF